MIRCENCFRGYLRKTVVIDVFYCKRCKQFLKKDGGKYILITGFRETGENEKSINNR